MDNDDIIDGGERPPTVEIGDNVRSAVMVVECCPDGCSYAPSLYVSIFNQKMCRMTMVDAEELC